MNSSNFENHEQWPPEVMSACVTMAPAMFWNLPESIFCFLGLSSVKLQQYFCVVKAITWHKCWYTRLPALKSFFGRYGSKVLKLFSNWQPMTGPLLALALRGLPLRYSHVIYMLYLWIILLFKLTINLACHVYVALVCLNMLGRRSEATHCSVILNLELHYSSVYKVLKNNPVYDW